MTPTKIHAATPATVPEGRRQHTYEPELHHGSSPPPPPDHPLPDGRVKSAYGVANAIDSRRPLTRAHPSAVLAAIRGGEETALGPKPGLAPPTSTNPTLAAPRRKQVSIRDNV